MRLSAAGCHVTRIRYAVAMTCVATTLFPVACSLADAPDTDEIVVTASRFDVERSRVGDSITVISSRQAEESQKIALADLLTTTPGVAASRNGGIGTQTSVRIRGAESEHTLVLIDGIRISDPSSASGGYNVANLLVNNIQRVEILRGAHSTLWGSQAIGGVINIVTPTPESFGLFARGETGSNGTVLAGAEIQDAGEQFRWRVGANHLTTDGISAFDEDLGGAEHDAYRNTGAYARLQWTLSDTVSAEARSYFWNSHSDIDGYPPPAYTFADTPEHSAEQQFINYGAVTFDTLEKRLQHRLSVAHSEIDRDNQDPSQPVSTTFDASGRTLRGEYQGTLQLSEKLTAVFGAEREAARFSTASPTQFDPDPAPLRRDMRTNSVYAQVSVSPLSSLTLTGGARYDDHETFGSHVSSESALSWSPNQRTTFRMSYGEGFKAPTLYQLFSEYGNETLEPEESSDWDLGIEQDIGASTSISASYFNRNTRNLIDFVQCTAPTGRCATQLFGYYENVRSSTADGYEMAARVRMSPQLVVEANYTHLRATNDHRGSVNFGKRLARRPDDAGYVQVSYEFPGALMVTTAAQYVGKSFDDNANTLLLDRHVLVDLRLSRNFTERLQVYGRIENIFEEDYQTSWSYGSPGRGAYLGARLRY